MADMGHVPTEEPTGPIPLTTRLDPSLHQALRDMSHRSGKSMNQLLGEAVAMAISPPGGAAMISEERKAQFRRGYDARHDARHTRGELTLAALAYLLAYLGWEDRALAEWPWAPEALFHPGLSGAHTLARAGALIAAEIDRFTAGVAGA